MSSVKLSGQTTQLSPSHTLLSSLLDLDNDEIIQHSNYIFNLIRDLSLLNLNQHININTVASVVTQLVSNSNTQAQTASSAANLINSGNNLLSKWINKIVILLQSTEVNHQKVGLFFLDQVIRGGDYAVIKTQYPLFTRILFEIARPSHKDENVMSDKNDSTITSSSIKALQLLYQLLLRANLWPDVWREVSTLVTSRFTTVLMSYIMLMLPQVQPNDGDSDLPPFVVYISSIPAIRFLDHQKTTALIKLLTIAHDMLSRMPLNSFLRNHSLNLEICCFRLIDLVSDGFTVNQGQPEKITKAASLRKLSANILALLPHVQNLKTQQQHVYNLVNDVSKKVNSVTIIPYIPLKSGSEEAGTKLTAVEIDKSNNLVATDNKIGDGTSILMHDEFHNEKEAEKAKKSMYGHSHALGAKVQSATRAAQAFMDNDDHVNIPTDATHPTMVTSAIQPWTIAVRRTVATIVHLLDTSLPSSVLEDVMFASVVRSMHVDIEPYHLPNPTSSSTFANVETLSLRLDSLFNTLRQLLNVFPTKQYTNLFSNDGSAGTNVALQMKKQKTSMFNTAATITDTKGIEDISTTDSSVAMVAHLEMATLPSQDFLCAIPLYELLMLLHAMTSLDSVASTDISTLNSTRLSALAYQTIVPELNTHALQTLRLIILASKRSNIAPHAKSIATNLMNVLLKSSPSLAATSLGAAHNSSVVNGQNQLASVPSSALNLSKDNIRTLAYECCRSLVSVVGVASIYKVLIEKLVPHILADSAAFVTRFMLLARDTKRIYAVANTNNNKKTTVVDDDDEDEFLSIGMGAKNRRKAKKARKAELLSSLPGANFGQKDFSDDEDEKKKEESKTELTKTNKTASILANSTDKTVSSAFSALHQSISALAQFKSYRATLIQDGNGHFTHSQGTASLDNSSNPAIPHSINIGLPSAVVLPVVPSFGSELEVSTQTTVVSSALATLIAILSSNSAPSMMSPDLRSAIDRSLLTILLTVVDSAGSPVLPIPTSTLRLLCQVLIKSLSLPARQVGCLTPLIPYARHVLSWMSSHNDDMLARMSSDGIIALRSVLSPTAPPPALPTHTISALDKIKNATSNNTVGIAVQSNNSGNIFGGNTSTSSDSSAEASFPLYLYQYQRPFEYSNVDEMAKLSDQEMTVQTGIVNVRPAQNTILASNNHPGHIMNISNSMSNSMAFSETMNDHDELTPSTCANTNSVIGQDKSIVNNTPAMSLDQVAVSNVDIIDVIHEEVKVDSTYLQSVNTVISNNIDVRDSALIFEPEDDDEQKEEATDPTSVDMNMVDAEDDDDDDDDDSNIGLWSL